VVRRPVGQYGGTARRLERRERRQPAAEPGSAGRERKAARGVSDHGYDKDAIGKRLRRIEGQVRGIEKMVDEERYCIDILTQIGAAMTALENVGLKVLDDHVNHCVAGAIASGDEAEARAKTDELLAAVQRFAKTR
jgi:CsoR family transcriptional regulator, copper-sensing transcriptional repressor